MWHFDVQQRFFHPSVIQLNNLCIYIPEPVCSSEFPYCTHPRFLLHREKQKLGSSFEVAQIVCRGLSRSFTVVAASASCADTDASMRHSVWILLSPYSVTSPSTFIGSCLGLSLIIGSCLGLSLCLRYARAQQPHSPDRRSLAVPLPILCRLTQLPHTDSSWSGNKHPAAPVSTFPSPMWAWRASFAIRSGKHVAGLIS